MENCRVVDAPEIGARCLVPEGAHRHGQRTVRRWDEQVWSHGATRFPAGGRGAMDSAAWSRLMSSWKARSIRSVLGHGEDLADGVGYVGHVLPGPVEQAEE